METLKTIQDQAHGIGTIPGAPHAQKRNDKSDKKKAEEVAAENTSVNRNSIDDQIRDIIFTDEKVSIKVLRQITRPPRLMEDESKVSERKYTISSDDKPHEDFLNALKMLRKHALQMCDIEIPENSVKLGHYSVTQVKIAGDYTMKKSRVQLVMDKLVPATGKLVPIGPTPQHVMYGESEYPEMQKLTPLIEKVIEEAKAYLAGKFDDSEDEEETIQLPLFT